MSFFLIKRKIIESILDSLYPNPISTLYYTNEYTLLIAIILTARSKEKTVNRTTKYLFKIINHPKDIFKISVDRLKNIIKNIGLHNKKSKNIYDLSIILINKYNCIIPKDFSKLKYLPGVGRKTASVFLSFVSKKPVFPIDTHIRRMMIRWKLSDGKNVEKTEKDAKKIFNKKNWKKLHLQIISYAKRYSPSKNWKVNEDIIYQKLLKNNLLS
ncbi:endonuclease III domain-containing protein [Blattabacterium cuenoti]|uniref:endonuclease III domain-containing protein n=1 Tax=Blattabacterium cuenoti TaxID=1653831 RepID=UPI00163C1EBF|nr:endonuclease III [Blattabacterium cuenoti]